ncbi:MAG: hypothetical protein HY549_08950 [Elusimicrobia bacterium]|nr:hypothetical protein [Elusimicrobiota bacterium]
MRWVLTATLSLTLGLTAFAEKEKSDKKDGAPESSTAVSDLYPNDMGPAEVDVSGYPKPIREGYKLMAFKCAACHTAARPINSQFLELSAEEEAAFKKENPDIHKDTRLVHIEDKIWNRYVKRMMAKPGCPVKGDDGKKIWEFLVYDSKARKTGANAKSWAAHRRKLLHEFAEHHPEAYKKLFGSAPAPKEN